MRSIRVTAKASDIDHLELGLEAPGRHPESGEALIRVASAGVNPSDVKAVLGAMPHAVWPRTPGRDYAGTVIEGPARLVGKEVWGSGGELGIRRDGTHAEWLVVSAQHVREKPAALSLLEAGAVGVPFITAWAGLEEAGGVKAGDVVLVMGGNGKVGQAAIQLATMAGARVFAVERRREPYRGHASGPVEMIGADAADIAAVVRGATDGHGADIVYNTVGSPYFAAANAAMAVKGRQIFISTIEREVPFDIFAFYRGRHRFVGIDTLALDSGDCAQILDGLKAGFERWQAQAVPGPGRLPLRARGCGGRLQGRAAGLAGAGRADALGGPSGLFGQCCQHFGQAPGAQHGVATRVEHGIDAVPLDDPAALLVLGVDQGDGRSLPLFASTDASVVSVTLHPGGDRLQVLRGEGLRGKGDHGHGRGSVRGGRRGSLAAWLNVAVRSSSKINRHHGRAVPVPPPVSRPARCSTPHAVLSLAQRPLPSTDRGPHCPRPRDSLAGAFGRVRGGAGTSLAGAARQRPR